MVQKQTTQPQPEKKNGRKPGRKQPTQPILKLDPLVELAENPTSPSRDSSIIALADMLSDTRMQMMQRHAIAAQIGKVHGNDYLQKFMINSQKTGSIDLKHQYLVQRRRLTDSEKVENLTSPRFAGDPQLEAAFDNDPPLKEGVKGDGITKIQQALIDDGFVMPITVRKTGLPNGFFNYETYQTVKWFQQKYELHADGEIGRNTLRVFDQLFGGQRPAPRVEPDISATEQATGEQVVIDINRANGPKTPNSGIWYSENYKRAHRRKPAIYRWDPDYANGLANPTYFERVDPMDWRLKPGMNASDGIKAWLRGLTIAECLSAMVAVQYDTLRAALGDRKFDEKFGGINHVVPESRRLRINTDTSLPPPLRRFMGATEAARAETRGTINNRPVKKGEWYYFSNHPKYPLKHPLESWQGENAVYMGKNRAGQQLWSGLGVSNATESQMYTKMVEFYNKPRTERDYGYIVTYCTKPGQQITTTEIGALGGNYQAVYRRYKNRILDRYREDRSEFDDRITKNKLLNDPEYTLSNPLTGESEIRKGGFIVNVGSRLNIAEVARVLNE